MRAGYPVAHAGMTVGLLGGSFDPPHEGHVHITEMALRRFALDRIWWLVSPGNPLKAHGPAPLPERIAQARRILDDPRVVVTGIEARLGTRMTHDTISELQRLYPGVRFVWLMGADNLVQFDRWDRWRDIARRVPIGVIARPGWRMPARFSRAARILWRWRLPERRATMLARMQPPAWVLINVPLNKLSSSAIRARLARRRR
ncbi:MULTISPECIES: nicotinate-nucleotide adenylyltransferase [unclassified Paracoccus (in: a-proteobacteria)]|uniref:nicotinate-nucleotide adenylyltransferase n=1 Tax=unclassified Paracoccus (in: a-proteobacteria) TaxID=2688777 RepID=UPI0012B3A589|nr:MULTISPECIES: nicotinate-nucleotide adenylyltransferase [unclassified Paracoccus (in: a-proteobacteria)]UXU76220.1 nicotinate-nucleotide adenylyltransferase [Paracoccus sp. SMMA_5]UXU82117.1 nicotinate-nucleotide adenylyltransferase [Paracoccus sp. SMMA_5_TC]